VNQRAIWACKICDLCCNRGVPPTPDSLPNDLATAHAMILAQREALIVAQAKAENAEAEARHRALLIEQMKFTIAKLKHERFGQSSERSAVLEQLELQLADMEEDASQAEAAAQLATAAAASQKVEIRAFERRKPARRPLPEHLPRERVVYPSPSACSCCGGVLHKLGEDVTETLELIPRQWKVIAHVREKFSCRSCETITQPPAPSHPIARGRAGPGLLAHILFAKYGLHLPLNRQSAVYAREGIELDVSTLADWVGAAAATLMPLLLLIRAHVFAAERIHADDTTVPVLAKGKTRTGRALDLCSRRSTVWRPRSARRGVLLLARSRRRASGAASRRLRGSDAGGRLCGVQPALRSGPQRRPDHRSGVLGPCAAQVLRPRPHQQGADRRRSRGADRRSVRHRTRDQWPDTAAARGRAQ